MCQQGGKYTAHAAHDRNLLIFLIKFQPFSDLSSDASSHLQRRALASGRTAAKMRQQSSYYYQRSGRFGNFIVCMYRVDYGVCADVFIFAKIAI